VIVDIFGNEVPLAAPNPANGAPRPAAYQQTHLIAPCEIETPLATATGTVRIAQGAFDLQGATDDHP